MSLYNSLYSGRQPYIEIIPIFQPHNTHYAVEDIKGKKVNSKKVLQVRMLGDFSLIWEGEKILCGEKFLDSQMTRLIQVLIYNRKEGLEKAKLQSLILGDSNADDTGHLIRSVIYNTQKKLEKSILPDTRYVQFRMGRYFWTEDIPVELDTEVFEKLCKSAEKETKQDKRLQNCLDAVYAYKGDFLPTQTGLNWVAGEERRLKSLFKKTTENAAEILKENNDYNGLEKLGKYAADVCPLDDYESLIIEALVCNGRINDARNLYEWTYERYQRELGIKPAPEQANSIERLFEQADRSNYFIKDIVAELNEDSPGNEGLYCSYPVFRGIYRMLMRTGNERTMSDWLILCTFIAEKGCTIPCNRNDAEWEEQIKKDICRSVDKSDIVCRYGKEQYLILARSRTDKSCEVVKKRIEECFRKTEYEHVSVAFSMQPIMTMNSGENNSGGEE